jgi:hypothetical protein
MSASIFSMWIHWGDRGGKGNIVALKGIKPSEKQGFSEKINLSRKKLLQVVKFRKKMRNIAPLKTGTESRSRRLTF